MNLTTSDQLTKVKKVSAFVRGAFQTLMVLVVLASLLKLVVLVVMPDAAVDMTDSGVNVEPGAAPSFRYRLNLLDIVLTADEVRMPLRIFTAITLVVSLVVYLKILQHLVWLFSGYAQGLIFTRDNVRQIRQIGITILAIPVIWIAANVGFTILEHTMAPGTFTIESNFPIMTILAGIIVVLMSWIMDVGRALYDENQLVI